MTDKSKQPGRRDILKTLGLGVGATAAASAAATTPARATESQDDRRKARYQESAHIKRYYETNRYPK